MKRLLLLFFLAYPILLQANVEELPWFSLNCNLRNADIIIQSKIIDNNGNLEIEKIFKGKLDNQTIINLKEFIITANEKINKGFPKEIGRKVILFIDSNEDEFNPSFWSWDLSTLWIEEDKYLGVFQPTNPGGYELYVFYKNENELKSKIDNWIFLENLILNAKEIESSQHRINYFIELLNWHPFKEDIILNLFEEKSIEPKIVLDLIWNIFNKKYLSKSELYPCGLLDLQISNFYQLTFELYRKVDQKGFQKAMQKVINSSKNHLNYMEWKESSEVNEIFILEFTKFINKNPIENWSEEKLELNKIIDKNEKYYNRPFLIKLRHEVKTK